MDHFIVGLGNPGPQYAKTRHNIGFMVTDRLADQQRLDLNRCKFNARYGSGNAFGRSLLVMQPQTFMNLSGRAVRPAADFFQIPEEQMLVVHDDLDLPFGTLKLKFGGGHGGHNGLRSLMTEGFKGQFVRLRFGIGRPTCPDTADYVLGRFTPEEQEWLPGLIDDAVLAIEKWITLGLQKAMNQVNTKPATDEKKKDSGLLP